MTGVPAHAATESTVAKAARATHVVHASRTMIEPATIEPAMIEPVMIMETEVMPVMEIAAKEQEAVVVVAIFVGIRAIAEIAVIGITAIGAGGQTEAEPDQQHRRPRQLF